MRKSEIKFTVSLDDDQVPEAIDWQATDMPPDVPAQTRSIAVSVWDHQQRGALRIDLWTKEMEVHEMKRFYIETIGGLADSLERATDDAEMAAEIRGACDRLSDLLRRELKGDR